MTVLKTGVGMVGRVVLIAAVIVSAVGLAGCANTAKGVGRDISRAAN